MGADIVVVLEREKIVITLLVQSLQNHNSSPPQITNTVPQKQHEAACSKIVTLDVSPTIAESIRRTHNGESISLLFGDWAEGAGVNGVGVY